MQLYKDILSRGWKVTTTYPQLWILGLFALLVSGVGGEVDRYLQYMNNFIQSGSSLDISAWSNSSWLQLVIGMLLGIAAGDVGIIVFSVAVAAALIVVTYMVMVAQGALIEAAHTTGKVLFTKVVGVGIKYAGKLLVLNILSYALLTSTVLGVTAILLKLNLETSTVIVLGALVLVPLVMIISFVVRFAANYIVIQQLSVLTSLSKAWKLFAANWLVSVEMAIIVFVLAILINLFIAVAALLMIAPYLSTVVVTGSATELPIYNAMFIGGIFYALALVLFMAIFTTWQWTAWTLLFERLQNERPSGKLIRLFKQS